MKKIKCMAVDFAVEWCHNQGLLFDAINDNLPELITMFGNNSRKISCDYYIDDKSISLSELQKKCYGGTMVE